MAKNTTPTAAAKYLEEKGFTYLHSTKPKRLRGGDKSDIITTTWVYLKPIDFTLIAELLEDEANIKIMYGIRKIISDTVHIDITLKDANLLAVVVKNSK